MEKLSVNENTDVAIPSPAYVPMYCPVVKPGIFWDVHRPRKIFVATGYVSSVDIQG